MHNIGKIDGEPMISNSNALIADPGYRHDYILTNLPFGKKNNMTFTNEDGTGSVIDTATDTVTATVPVVDGPEGVAIIQR